MLGLQTHLSTNLLCESNSDSTYFVLSGDTGSLAAADSHFEGYHPYLMLTHHMRTSQLKMQLLSYQQSATHQAIMLGATYTPEEQQTNVFDTRSNHRMLIAYHGSQALNSS